AGSGGILFRRSFLARDASLIASPAVERQTPRHPDEPRAETIAVPQLREHPMRSNEGLLRDVLGVLAVSQHRERTAKSQRRGFDEAGLEFLLERSIHGGEGA